MMLIERQKARPAVSLFRGGYPDQRPSQRMCRQSVPVRSIGG